MAPGTVLSLRPSTFVAGGLIDDVDAKITEAKFMMYDYNGSADVSVPALGLELELTDGTKHESYYSAGDAKFWAPSGDGKTLVATGDKSALTNQSKLGIFIAELVAAGFPEDKLSSGDISVLVGLTAHWQRKADPKRTGLVRTGKNADREQSTLIVVKILGLPGEAVKASPTKAAAGQPTTATAASSSTGTSADVDGPATEILLEVLPANGGSIAKNRLSQAVFKAISKGHPHEASKSAITSRVFNDEFLKAGAASGLWAFDGTTISLG